MMPSHPVVPIRSLALTLLASAGIGCAASAKRTTPPAKCVARPAVEAEIRRLVESAAAHATHSDVCVDAGGDRVKIETLEVCEGNGTGANLSVDVYYQWRTIPEGDTRGCATPDCGWEPGPVSSHQVALMFDRTTDGLLLRVPEFLPGMQELRGTSLHEEHRGDCTAEVPAFEARAVAE